MKSIEKLGERLEAMEHRARMMEQRLRWWRILACGLVVVGLVILPLVGGTAQEQSSYERAMARRLAALEYKLQYISGGLNEVVITGANLRIVNGLGSTFTTNGLGNLIVGYNELREQICGGNPDPACIDGFVGSQAFAVLQKEKMAGVRNKRQTRKIGFIRASFVRVPVGDPPFVDL